MVAYADSSFLVSLYGQDRNSRNAARVMRSLSSALVLTPLQRHETCNAFRLAVLRSDITRDQCQAVLTNLQCDIESGLLLPTQMAWADTFHAAEALSAAHTEHLGVRATDILHVAAAKTLEADWFLTFDARQGALARKAGMKVKP